jgi:hypothetical protein
MTHTATDLLDLAKKRHRGGLFIEELRLGCGYSNGSERRIDRWPSIRRRQKVHGGRV